MTLSNVDRRYLTLAAEGKQAQLDYPALTAAAIILGGLAERGLVRLVKHRDGTRTYTPTALGRVHLTARAA